MSLQQAKDWAFSIIKSLDTPPPGIIEVAMSRGLPELIEKLNAVSGDRDIQLAGRWLLSALNRELQSDSSAFKRIVRQAMRVARSTGLGDDEYYTFDAIDDSICLAENDTYGSLDLCRSDLTGSLAKYKEGVNAGEQ